MWVGNYTAENVSPFHGSSKAFVQEGPETWLVLQSQTYFVQSGDNVVGGGSLGRGYISTSMYM